MAQDGDKKEEKLDSFTPAGEALGYITLEQARIQAIQHARDNTEFYGPRYARVSLVWEVTSQEEGEDFYDIRLSFRPAGRFRGEPGVEQFIIDKTGDIQLRQILDEPSDLGQRVGRRPRWLLPSAVGVVVVGVVAVVGIVASGVLAGSGPDPTPTSLPIAAISPTQAPTPMQNPVATLVEKRPAPTPLVVERQVVVTPTPAPTPTPAVVEREVVREVQVVVTPTPVPVAARVVPTAVPTTRATPAPMARYGSVAVMAANSDVQDWDPAGSGSFASVLAYSQLYNQIVQYDTTDTNEIVGDLAKSWDVSPDGQTITFHLHEDIRWQDGRDLNAGDVVFSMRRYMDPETSMGRSGLFRNYAANVRAAGPDTVIFNLKFSSPAAIKYLALDYAKVLPRRLLERGVDLNMAENVIANRSGSGPFMQEEHQPGSVYKVNKNPNYFKQGRPFFDGIEHHIITDGGRLLAAFLAGQVQMMNGGITNLTPGQFLRLKRDTGGKVIAHKIPVTIGWGLMINVKQGPLADPRIRRAIYLALDRQQFNDLLFEGTGEPPTIFAGMVYSPEEALAWPGVRPKNTASGRQDILEARSLMADAGYPDGFLTTFDVRQVGSYPDQCAVVKEQLRNALGIDGDVRTHDSAAGFQLYETSRPVDKLGDWELACQAQSLVVPDPDAVFAGLYLEEAVLNYTGWSHPVINDLFQAQRRELDPEKRRNYLREAADFLRSFRDNHWITLAWGGGRFSWLVRRDIRGFNPPQTSHYGFKHEDLWLDR